jgi:hypothetical protein
MSSPKVLRRLQAARDKKTALHDLESRLPVHYVPAQYVKTGADPSKVREDIPGLRERDYQDIDKMIAWLKSETRANRHERRAKAARERRVTRAYEKRIGLNLDKYGVLLGMFSPQTKRVYDRILKRGPNPESPLFPHMLDSEDLAETKRSYWEMLVAFRLQERIRRMAARQARSAAAA